MKKIEIITNKDLEKASAAVFKDRAYGPETNLIRDCLIEFPKNNDVNVIAMKCGLIDITNSTNLSRYKSRISIVELANVILNVKNLDERIKTGDLSVVGEIAKTTSDKYGINLFSFASKYCVYHNIYVYGGDAFSIYDNVMKENLPSYIGGVSKYKLDTLRKKHDYVGYMNIINEILENNNITTEFKRRKLDNFIWYYNR